LAQGDCACDLPHLKARPCKVARCLLPASVQLHSPCIPNLWWELLLPNLSWEELLCLQ